MLPGYVDGHHITAGCSTMHRHSWVFSSTSVMLSSCLHSRFVLSLHFAYRLQLMLSSCFQSAVLCVCVFFCVVISLTSFMLSSCLRSLFQFCILVFHVVSAMAAASYSALQSLYNRLPRLGPYQEKRLGPFFRWPPASRD